MALRLPKAPSSAALLFLSLVVLVGCRGRQHTNCPTPAASGLNVRDLIDPVAQSEAEASTGIERFNDASKRLGERIREELAKDAPPNRPPRNVLCLSGGGSYGAYSAGVLVGWTERGRPMFDVVTGVSTGALIAPFAFLGQNYDAQLTDFYTTSTNRDIFRRRYVRGLLGGESFADTAPLRRKITEFLTPQTIAELAQAHQAGRRLMLATTEEEGKRIILWDVGAIACRNGPRDRDLIIDVMVGSAAIPGVFPSSKIDVSVAGECHTERHVDGGVSQALFFYAPYVPPETRTPQTMNLVGTNVYIIVAGKLFADAEVIRPSALSLAGKAVSALTYAQTRGDLQRLWIFSLLNGMNYNLTAIPAEYTEAGSSGEFDPKVMTGLFNVGRQVVCSPSPWRSTPPMTDPAQGEFPQARLGRDLVFQPRGPQLPIKSANGKRIAPKYPEASPNTASPAIAPILVHYP